MTGSLQWLNELMRAVGKLVPRWTLVPPSHAGVRFGPKGGAKNLGAGLKFWWPVVHQLKQVSMATRSIAPGVRCFPATGADRVIPRIEILGLALQFRVFDPVLASTKAMSLGALVDNRTQAAAAGAWEGPGTPDESITTKVLALNPELSKFGIVLDRADVVNRGTVVGMLHHKNTGYSDGGDT